LSADAKEFSTWPTGFYDECASWPRYPQIFD
jgi:hypothetical protein